jgi:hypothetical protein
MVRLSLWLRKLDADVSEWLSGCDAVRILRGRIERKHRRWAALIELDIAGIAAGLALGAAAAAVAFYVIPQIESSIASFNYLLGGM